MIKFIARTFKQLLSDKRGDDYTEASTKLTSAAKVAIALGGIAAAAAGASSLSNSSNAASDTAAQKVNAPIGAQASTTTAGQAVYK